MAQRFQAQTALQEELGMCLKVTVPQFVTTVVIDCSYVVRCHEHSHHILSTFQFSLELL